MTDSPAGRPKLDPLAPYPTLAERDAGTPPEPDSHEGVPRHMESHLHRWVLGYLTEYKPLADRVVRRLRLSWTASVPSQGLHGERLLTSGEVLVRLVAGKLTGIRSPRPIDPLTIVDALVVLHPYWEAARRELERYQLDTWVEHLTQLRDVLEDCGSVWYLDTELRGLYRRVDPTATEAWRRARESAEKSGRVKASEELARAWRELYGQNPDPSASYAAAVRAVENAALPVVFPDRKERGQRKTVHMVRTELRGHDTRWRFVLVDDDTTPVGHGSVEVVATMLHRLLRGETDRHADDENRPSEQHEAAAALHLAVLLVQWFVTGAIQPRESS